MVDQQVFGFELSNSRLRRVKTRNSESEPQTGTINDMLSTSPGCMLF